MTTQQFISRNGALLTNNSLNLTAENDYRIDDVPVLSAKALGVTVTTSNLKQLGTLNSLSVSGDTALGEFAFFNTTFNRFGLGTEEPGHSLSIIDNNVEIGLGSPDFDHAEFGTYSNHTLTIVTDGLPRIAVKSNGGVDINGDLTVKGTLTVDSIVSETRVTKTDPIEFLPNSEGGVYGLGVVWSGKDYQRQIILRSNPDRFWATNSIDLEKDQAYYVNGRPVLTETALGSSITQSNLIKVGALEELTVTGPSVFQGSITANNSDIAMKSIRATGGLNGDYVYITGDRISSNGDLNIVRREVNVLGVDDTSISIGDFNAPKAVKLAGNLSIGVNNPNSKYALQVAGDVILNNKKFITGFDAPNQGDFNQGDICWNANPGDNGYVGWICIVGGTPGIWRPFGAIGVR